MRPHPRRPFHPVARTGSAVGLVAALLVAACAELSDRGSPPVEKLTEAGVTRELARHRKATLAAPRYAYRLRVPAALDSPVTGEAGIRFRRDGAADAPVILDFREPAARIREVRVNGERVEPVFRNDHVLLPAAAFARRGGGRGDPSAEEAGEGAGQGAGESEGAPGERVEISFRAGDEALNRTEEFLYTLFVPDRAHAVLPLFDQPDLKGPASLTLELPEGWEALTADSVRPLAPYLFAFAAGEFRVERADRAGRGLTLLHRETDSARVARNLAEIFDLHGTALDWLEEYTGIPYPYERFGTVAVPSFQYGGMEHPGAVFYRADALFLDESATQGDRLDRASLVAHETAHMWFGDLVTMEWFDDVWMKEVFANFMAARIVHPSFPGIDHDLRFLLAHHPAAYGVDRTAGAHPIRQELENLAEAGSLYGAIIYRKAPIVMRQLELLVGERTLREGLRTYLRDHAHGNASWPDLISILDERTPHDLAAWSGVWVTEAGRPEIRADREEADDGTIVRLGLRQRDPAGEGRVWPQVVDLVLGYGSDSTVALSAELVGRSVGLEGAAGLPAPDYVLPGGRGVGYGRMRLDPASLDWLASGLPDVSDPRVRGAGWITLWDAVLEGELAPARFVDLAVRAVSREEVELVLERVLGYLDAAWWRLLEPGERAARNGALEGALEERLRGGDPGSVKAALFRSYRDLAGSEEAAEWLRELWAGERRIPGLPLSERDRTALAAALALREVDGWAGILETQSDRIANPDRRARFEFLRPSLSADPAVREAFFARLADPANRRREPWVLEGLSHLHHPLRAAHGEGLIRPALEMLEEVRRTGDIFFPKGWLDATLGGHSSPAAARMVREFLAETPDLDPRLRGKLLQSADLLFRAAEIGGVEARRATPGRRGE